VLGWVGSEFFVEVLKGGFAVFWDGRFGCCCARGIVYIGRDCSSKKFVNGGASKCIRDYFMTESENLESGLYDNTFCGGARYSYCESEVGDRNSEKVEFFGSFSFHKLGDLKKALKVHTDLYGKI